MTYRANKASPLGDETLSIQEADRIIYGGSEPPASGRVVGKPIDIMQICPDVTQPRRVIPAAIRGKWDGDPAAIRGMLVEWQNKVAAMLKPEERFYAQPILKKEAAFKINPDEQPRMIQSFIELINLAENIYEKGLNLPITVSKVAADRYLLHTGERRLMAHHLLNAVFGTHDKIAAIEREHNVWSQIAENTQRSQMNAVSMARALAKLKMEMYAGEMTFEQYSDLLDPSGCDKAFYAQVVEMDIKYGMGDQVMNALNIANKTMVSRYNRILRLPDEVWMQADDEDWTEGRVRQWFEDQKPQKDERWLPIGNQVGVSSHPAPLRSDFGRSGSNFEDEDDLPRYRTVVGERMGLYEDTPHPPAPSPTRGEGEQARPVITYLSTDAEWRAAGYAFCPHPDEMGPGESWADADEVMAAEAARMAAEIDANALEQNNTPLSVELEFTLLDALIEVARVLDDRKTKQALTFIRNRGREDIRLWMLEHQGDLDGYKKKLQGEGEQVGYLLDQAKERLWDFLAHQYAAAEAVRERM